MDDRRIDAPCIMTIFGGKGDLANRKLLPALYNLASEGLLPEEFAVVGISRTAMNHTEYRQMLTESAEKYASHSINQKIWNILISKVYYYRMDATNPAEYGDLKRYLETIDEAVDAGGNRLYYLSVAPDLFETISVNLKNHGMAENSGSWQRVMIEKPFGKNLETARYLNGVISEIFPAENVFRIDHYLGKEMLQNLLVIRFGNAIFEGIWDSRYIDNIQITASESIGVENRAGYYDTSGALRDMMQNHMLQLLSLVAMEAPVDLSARSIRDEKVKLLRSIGKLSGDNIRTNIIRGQYGKGTINGNEIKSFREEKDINPESKTETFVAMKLDIGNFRWGNVPFYLRTGKRMAEKSTNIVIEFKSMPEILYFKEYKGMLPNLLIIRVQPREGISITFNTKKPGTINEIAPVDMDFCQNCQFENNSPEAYERLIADALRNDQTLFTSWEEIEAMWSFVDEIDKIWSEDEPEFPNYEPASWGPDASDELLKRDNRKWWNIS